jgi:hypothetical protein
MSGEISLFTVITSFSPSGYEAYAHKFISSFFLNWPQEVNLICAWEGVHPDPNLNGFDLLSTEPARSFYFRWATSKIVKGLQEGEKKWGPKARRKGYSFRHDAWRFSHKVFAVAAASRYVEGGKLFWIDADVVTNRPVATSLLDSLLADDIHLSYIPRTNYHSECGFVGYNLEHKETREFIEAYERQYSLDRFLSDDAWDDCHQLDYLIKASDLRCFRINSTHNGQPFDTSILGEYMTHYKGARKPGGIAG